jgi:transposase
MRKRRYPVQLSGEQCNQLNSLLHKGKHSSRELNRARVLLLCNQQKEDKEVAQLVGVSEQTVRNIRRRFLQEGVDATLDEKKRPGAPQKLNIKGEAYAIALACSDPPEGRKCWTLQMIADKLVELKYVDSITAETVRLCFKKKRIKPWQYKQWCIPEVDAAFICQMEDVLDLYEEDWDSEYPIVCLDEKPYQLLDHTRTPLPMKPGKPKREDYTYKRNGTCNLFILFSPQAGWRHVKVTKQRTAKDYAECVKDLVDMHFPDAKRIRIVQDNLNTHKGASLYKRYPAEEARRIYKKVEFHYTPKHASWLNMAEIEIHVLGKQCTDRRISDMEILEREIAPWEEERNHCEAVIDWQFTTEKARDKFEKAYDNIKN